METSSKLKTMFHYNYNSLFFSLNQSSLANMVAWSLLVGGHWDRTDRRVGENGVLEVSMQLEIKLFYPKRCLVGGIST